MTAAMFHPVSYQYYFYYIAGLAIGARTIACGAAGIGGPGMSCPSRVEVDDQTTMASPLPASRAEVPGEPVRLLKFLAQLAIGGSERHSTSGRASISRDSMCIWMFRRFDEQIERI